MLADRFPVNPKLKKKKKTSVTLSKYKRTMVTRRENLPRLKWVVGCGYGIGSCTRTAPTCCPALCGTPPKMCLPTQTPFYRMHTESRSGLTCRRSALSLRQLDEFEHRFWCRTNPNCWINRFTCQWSSREDTSWAKRNIPWECLTETSLQLFYSSAPSFREWPPECPENGKLP